MNSMSTLLTLALSFTLVGCGTPADDGLEDTRTTAQALSSSRENVAAGKAVGVLTDSVFAPAEAEMDDRKYSRPLYRHHYIDIDLGRIVPLSEFVLQGNHKAPCDLRVSPEHWFWQTVARFSSTGADFKGLTTHPPVKLSSPVWGRYLYLTCDVKEEEPAYLSELQAFKITYENCTPCPAGTQCPDVACAPAE